MWQIAFLLGQIVEIVEITLYGVPSTERAYPHHPLHIRDVMMDDLNTHF